MSNEFFSSGTSLEHFTVGEFDPKLADDTSTGGPYVWFSSVTDTLDRVMSYSLGEAYDYEAHGLVRNPCFDLEEFGESDQDKYLSLAPDLDLQRSIFQRDEYEDAFSNVVVRTGARESLYCDMLTKFTFGEDEPILDDSIRLVVWARSLDPEEGDVATNLMVTAGYFTNSFTRTLRRSYRLDLSEACPGGLDPDAWYRLTIRAHGDVSPNGAGLAGFTVYLDGKPLSVLAEDYEICEPSGLRQNWLSPEARGLFAARRLVPGLSAPGSDEALTISGLTFKGEGVLDDLTFSSDDPGYGAPDTVFTLSWGAGLTSLKYSLDGGVTVTNAPVTTARSLDLLLGAAATNGFVLKVTECVYDTANGFKPGVWLGSNGATVTNVNETVTSGEFVFDGTTRNPMASVAATSESLEVGPGGAYDTFASAFAALDSSTNEVKVLRLAADIVVPSMKPSQRDAYGNRDLGYVNASSTNGEYVLDLNGHTLQGSGKYPTLAIRCKSFRICDSSSPDPATKQKTGRILPARSHTNESDRLNTAVQVYPQEVGDGTVIEPVLTIQDGIYDGWVRNPVNVYTNRKAAIVRSYVGAIFVEGGSFISTNESTFYLESYVTNPMLQYVYRSGYWSQCGETNTIIWTGLGDGRRWLDPENWKVHRVPKATETALFPSRSPEEGPWTVDVEDNQMTTTDLWLEGDVYLSGTNDFRYVTLVGGGAGLICGDALLVWDGDQPGKLTETMLRDDWAGTVLVRNVGYPKTKSPKVLKSMETWGTATSTVEFNGVRGYVMDVYAHTMPYDFVLRDYVYTNDSNVVVTNLAWQNDSGYTGSTLAFKGALRGNGTFSCAGNTRSVLQLFKFANVTNYTGRLDINGKRVLIGTDREVSTTAGLIAFGDVAFVNANLGWQSRYGLFGETLYVTGQTNDVLLTCTMADPDLSVCSNVFLNGQSEPCVELTSSGTKPYKISITWVPTPEPDPENGLFSFAAPTAFATAPLLTAQASSAQDGGYAVAAAQAAAYAVAATAVADTDVSLEVCEDEVHVFISNASRGLWYGVRHRTSLAEEWIAPSQWLQATGTTVTLTCPKSDESGFYGVVVAVEDPSRGGGTP